MKSLSPRSPPAASNGGCDNDEESSLSVASSKATPSLSHLSRGSQQGEQVSVQPSLLNKAPLPDTPSSSSSSGVHSSSAGLGGVSIPPLNARVVNSQHELSEDQLARVRAKLSQQKRRQAALKAARVAQGPHPVRKTAVSKGDPLVTSTVTLLHCLHYSGVLVTKPHPLVEAAFSRTTRKVYTAPPPPTYIGFSNAGSLQPTRARATQPKAPTVSSVHTRSSSAPGVNITPSSWRTGQQLANKVLGEKKSKEQQPSVQDSAELSSSSGSSTLLSSLQSQHTTPAQLVKAMNSNAASLLRDIEAEELEHPEEPSTGDSFADDRAAIKVRDGSLL